MRMRSFVAPTLAEAMAQLRAELGPEAFVIATDEPEGGPARVVAATAAADGPGPAPAAAPAATRMAEGEPPAASRPSALGALLARHGVPERLAALLRRAEIETDGVMENLRPALAAQFDFAPIEATQAAPPMLLAGPPGCGKTATVAKIAALFRGQGRAVRLITADTLRAAAAEQLQRYAQALGCGFAVAATTAALGAMTTDGDAAAGSDRPIDLIDTPGLDLVRREDRQSLLDWCEAAETTPVLVLPAGHDAEESAEAARAFAALGGARMIATRLDAARRLGNLLAAAQAGGLAFLAGGISPRIAGGLVALDAGLLSRLLVEDPRAVCAALASARREATTARGGASPG
jgi:flagellar biosynthesis protein FlhF